MHLYIPSKGFVCIREGGYTLSLTTARSPEPPSTFDGPAPLVLCADFNKDPPTSSTKPGSATPCYACLGVINIAGDIYVVVVTDMEFTGVGGTDFTSTRRVKKVKFFPLTPVSEKDTPRRTQAVGMILENNSFYFSTISDEDLSTPLSIQQSRRNSPKPTFFDLPDSFAAERLPTRHPASDLSCTPDFVFNLLLLSPLLELRQQLKPELKTIFDSSLFATPCIQGYVGETEIMLDGEKAVLTVVSRLCWRRTGTRFNCRGINEEGYVANNAETETILKTNTHHFSYVVVRGSVPLFWTEAPSIADVSLSISDITESHRPFRLHFERLFTSYPVVHCLDLLITSTKHESTLHPEIELGNAYAKLIKKVTKEELEFKQRLSYEKFDFLGDKHLDGLDKVGDILKRQVEDLVEEFGISVIEGDVGEAQAIKQEQAGVFRVNCRDCVDRTNMVQTFLSLWAFEKHWEETGFLNYVKGGELEMSHRLLMSENGNALSTIYCGTGSMFSLFNRTGHSSARDMILNFVTTEKRTEQWKEHDSPKQLGIEQLVGRDSNKLAVGWYPTDTMWDTIINLT